MLSCRSKIVAKKIAPSLNRFASATVPQQSGLDVVASLPELLRAYQAATGWQLSYQSSRDGRVDSSLPADLSATTCSSVWSAEVAAGPHRVGRLSIAPEQPQPVGRRAREKADAVSRQPISTDTELPPAARKLARAVADVLNELLETRYALWQREAELAAQVPFVPHRAEAAQLAARLEAVLRAGAEAVGCQAAALYLLDDRTEYLKLRASWGLPFDRLLAPPRSLSGAVADLEAMLGHAVVLEEARECLSWQPPEDFASAVCLPVSTPTNLLGTVWFFCDRKRDFSSRETNLLEVAAGRLAVELEREILLAHCLNTGPWREQIDAAERLQQSQLPGVPPMLDDWQLSGWAHQLHRVGGAFYDWFCCPDGRIGFALGRAESRSKHGGWDAALTAANIRTALRVHGQYQPEPHDVIRQANMTLWVGSAGDQQSAAVFGTVQANEARLRCSFGGDLVCWRMSARDDRMPTPGSPLGESPESSYQTTELAAKPGEFFLWLTPSLFGSTAQRSSSGRSTARRELESIVALVRKNRHLSAAAMTELLARTLTSRNAPADDAALLVIKYGRS